MNMKRILAGLTAGIGAILLNTGDLTAGELAVKDGDKIAFLGDSITSLGWSKPCGYTHLVIEGLKQAGVNAVPVPAGISGNRSTHMNARVERDVIAKKPTWMTLSCGVNDVWHGKNGVPLDQYKKEITALLDKADKAGIKVMILTATMVREDANNEQNRQLVPYNDFLRAIAKERNYLIADLNADMQTEIAAKRAADPKFKGNLLTVDGVHMNLAGNKMMASGILRAFGVPRETVDGAISDAWKNLPGAFEIHGLIFSENEWAKLEKAAGNAKLSPRDYVRKIVLDQLEK